MIPKIIHYFLGPSRQKLEIPYPPHRRSEEHDAPDKT